MANAGHGGAAELDPALQAAVLARFAEANRALAQDAGVHIED